MDKRLHRLEAWRLAQGINKTQMAELLGANSPQAYTNWLGRGSLPKDYYDTADSILACPSIADAAGRLGLFGLGTRALRESAAHYSGAPTREALETLQALDHPALMDVMRALMPGLTLEQRAALARIALADLPET